MSTIPPEERQPVLEHKHYSVVPQTNNSGFIILFQNRTMYVGRDQISWYYNLSGSMVQLLGPRRPILLRELHDVLGILFLLEGFERTRNGSLLEEMKQILDEEKLDRILVNPYEVRPKTE